MVDRYLDVHGTALVEAVTAAETGAADIGGPEATAPADREIQAGLDRLGCGEEVARLVCERMPGLYADAGVTWTEEMALRCGQ
ncbi:hypothetical protein ACFPM7_06620 [Actinokineospora guangxiensis]|uniref:Uncharacterized protein n=1 Tax=Actinokineospora guangxiensis TaxID=1490288 RepID=A0ABW0EH48_9PSEU